MPRGSVRCCLIASLLGCASVDEDPRSPRSGESLSAVCNSKDDPALLSRWEESAGREVISGEILASVSTDPGLHVGVAWAASYVAWEEIDVNLAHLSAWQLTSREQTRRGPKPWFHLHHLEDGTLEIHMSDAVGDYVTTYALAQVMPRKGELVATLRSHSSSDHGPTRQNPIVGGELRLSSASWSVGTELSMFLEVAELHGIMCGEARFVVPPRGQQTNAL